MLSFINLIISGLYNAYLAPGSPCELNIDHNLRNALAARMASAVGNDNEILGSLNEVAILFDSAQTSVFKLMASVSFFFLLSSSFISITNF